MVEEGASMSGMSIGHISWNFGNKKYLSFITIFINLRLSLVSNEYMDHNNMV
jgi:hypothetical protein